MVIELIPAPWVLPALVALVQVNTRAALVIEDVGAKVISVNEVVADVDDASVVPTETPPIDASIVALLPDKDP